MGSEPDAEAPCAAVQCAPGEQCVDGACVWLGAQCERHYDCVNSACEIATGRCLRACSGEPQGDVVCDAEPWTCPAGTSFVTTSMCWDCRDPRLDCAGAASVGCDGARWVDGAGCEDHEGVALAASCCAVGHYPQLYGLVAADCDEAGAPRLTLSFGVGRLTCEAEGLPVVRVVVPYTLEAPWDAAFELGVGGAWAERCDATGCVPASAGGITLGYLGMGVPEGAGRLWVELPDGEVVDATFEVDRCGGPARCD